MIAEKLIKELEIVTGVKADLIDYMADTVIYEACYGDQSGIPEISLDYFQMLIKKIQPNSFEDLVQLACLCHDTDAWMPVQMYMLDNDTDPFANLIASREDVYDLCVAHGIDKEMATKIMAVVRKGLFRRHKDLYEDYLIQHDIGERFIKIFTETKYLYTRSQAELYIKNALILMWYKMNYLSDYIRIYFEIEKKEEEC